MQATGVNLPVFLPQMNPGHLVPLQSVQLTFSEGRRKMISGYVGVFQANTFSHQFLISNENPRHTQAGLVLNNIQGGGKNRSYMVSLETFSTGLAHVFSQEAGETA